MKPSGTQRLRQGRSPQATHAQKTTSLRASAAQRGNPVNKSARSAQNFYRGEAPAETDELCTLNFEKTRRWRVFYSTQIDATLVGAVAEPTGIWTYAVVAVTVVPLLVKLVTYLPAVADAGLNV